MSEFTIKLDIPSLKILEQKLDIKGNIVLTVESTENKSVCHKCGKDATKYYGYAPSIQVRHLSILDTPVYLNIRPIRYQCEHCEDHTTTTEQYEWCDRKSKTTKGLDKYIARSMINSTVSDVARKENISYKTLMSSINRLIGTKVNWGEYKDLHVIGIDEISDRKGYKDYIVIISVRTKSGALSVIAVLSDRKKETVKAFLESIPKNLKKTVKTVCTDMYDGFVNSAIEVFGQQVVVIDRYHIAKLYRKPLDTLRIKEMQRLKRELTHEEYSKLEGAMWALRKQYECLTEIDKSTLETIYKYSPALKKAHSYALKLTHIFNAHTNRKSAVAKVDRWITSVEKSDVNCFKQFIETLKKYKFGIVNYFKSRKSSGFVEGLNNKIKVIKRRCYGFFKVESLFQRIFLDLCGYKLYAN